MKAGMEDRAMTGGQAMDSELEQRARALLIGSAENLPGTVRSRLTQARHAALAVRHARLRYRLQRWLPAGAVAAAALALLVVFVPHGQHASGNAINPLIGNGAGVDEIELLSSEVPLNADKDVDNDFYEWAVDAANGVPSGPAHATATGTNGT
jgi:hypothetical protein